MTDDLISRQALIAEIMRRGIYPPGVRHAIENAPAIDAVEVVRCKDCVSYEPEPGTDLGWCPVCSFVRWDDDFCSYGERKENND